MKWNDIDGKHGTTRIGYIYKSLLHTHTIKNPGLK